jgi:hypothetical protein
MFITKDNPTASYFTRVVIIFLVCVSMLLLMFLPKMKLMACPQTTTQSTVYCPRTKNDPNQSNITNATASLAVPPRT